MTNLTSIGITNEVLTIVRKNNIQIDDQEEIIADGDIHRFNLLDEARGKNSGWYVIRDNLLSFGSWKTGEKFNVKIKNNGCYFKQDKQKYLLEKRELEDKRKEAYRIAALKAWSIWEDAEKCKSHQYLDRKMVKPLGIRVLDGNLLIPLNDKDNQIESLQFINKYGNKWFMKGGKIKGSYFVLGDLINSNRIFISEGFATAATLFEVSNLPQVIAFNASNIVEVAKNIRLRFPSTEIVIAADNDSKSTSNIGIAKAKEAMRIVKCKVIYPEFISGDLGTDFNDYANLYGKQALLEKINRTVKS